MLGQSSPKINSQANKRVNRPVRSNYFSSTFQRTNNIFVLQQISISQILVTRFDRTKRARCLVGSPTLRIINQIQVSPTLRSPRSMTTQNSRNSCVNQMQVDSHSLFFNLGEQIVKSSVVCAGEKGLCKQPPVERCEGLEVCNPTLYNTNYVSGEEEKDNRPSGDRSALASPAPGASDIAGMARAYQEATMMQMKSSDTEAPTPTEDFDKF